jgi:glycosyltransferase involved in cell wall biosynthesis
LIVPRPDVALIAPYPERGRRHAGSSGVASYTANLAQALAGAGVEVTVVAPRLVGEPPVLHDGPVRVQRSFDTGAMALPRAARAAVDTGAPIVHVQHELFLHGARAVPALVPTYASLRAAGVGPAVTMHQVVAPRDVDRSYTRLHRVGAPAPVARAGIAALQQGVARTAAVTIVHEDSFTDVLPGATVIPHGVEHRTSPARSIARAELQLPDDGALLVVCFGFVAPYKGLETALTAAELAGPSIRLVIAGGEHPRLAGRDRYEAELRRRWGHAALFTGWVPEDDVARWFAAADVALLPYLKPFASSGALALALAHRTPVLVSEPLARCTALPAGCSFPVDAVALAARLLQLDDERDSLAELAACGERLAEERAWPVVARRHAELYEEVIHDQRAARRRLRARQPG